MRSLNLCLVLTAFRGALGVEIACNTVTSFLLPTVPVTYTLSGDLSCPEQQVFNITNQMTIEVFSPSVLSQIHFNVDVGVNLTFIGEQLTMSDSFGETLGGSITANGNVTFKNAVHFDNNYAQWGGAVFVSTGYVVFEQAVTFSNNAAVGGPTTTFGDLDFRNASGGAVFVSSGNVVFEQGAVFTNNVAQNGAGVYVDTGEVDFLATSTFINNIASVPDKYHPGAYGGAVSINAGTVQFGLEATFTGNGCFSPNPALGGGMVVYSDGSAYFASLATFTDNIADYGGGVYVYDGALDFAQGAVFNNNTANYLGSGGAIYMEKGDLNVDDDVFFTNNTADVNGGAVYISLVAGGEANFASDVIFSGNDCGRLGGALYLDSEKVNFAVGASFTDNFAGDSGGAVYVAIIPNEASPGPSLVLANVQLIQNSAAERGGGICVGSCNSMFLANITASGNTATDGGFLSVLFCSVGWFDSTVTENKATGRGGGFTMLLAPPSPPPNAVWLSEVYAAYANLPASVVVPKPTSIITSSMIMNVNFFGNTAGTAGGSVFLDSSNLLVQETQMSAGSALSGGAIYLGSFLSAEITDCIMENNVATSSGGSLFAGTGAVLNMTDSSITNSTSTGGAGGALYSDGLSQVTISHCTIQGANASLYGGGIGGQDTGSVTVSDTSITDTSAGCCFPNNPYAYAYTCSALSYGGNDIYQCCLADQYWDSAANACTPCDSNTMSCTDVGITTQTIPLLPGFWRASAGTTDIRECLNPDACQGGSGGGVQGAGDSFADGTQYCAQGYEGPYCSVCAGNYFSSPGHTCSQCASSLSTGVIVWCFTVTGLFLLALCFITIHLTQKEEKDEVKEKVEELSEEISAGAARGKRIKKLLFRWSYLLGQFHWGRLRIPIVAAQIVSQCVAVTGVRLPSGYEKFLAWANFASLDFNMLPALSCQVHINFYNRLLFVTIVPLLGVLYLCTTYAIARWRDQRVAAISFFSSTSGDSFRYERVKRQVRRRHIRAFLILTFLVYSTVSATVFQTFSKDDTCDNNEVVGVNYTFLRADYSIPADTREYRNYVIYAAFMVFLYPAGIPALYAYLLWRSRKRFLNRAAGVRAKQLEEELGVKDDDVEDDTYDTAVAPLDGQGTPPRQLSHKKARSGSAAMDGQSRMSMRRRSSGRPVDLSEDAAEHLKEFTRFLWGGYISVYFYWEVIECMRRLLMTGVIVFLFPGTAAQLSITCLFALLSIFVIAMNRPHIDKFDFQLYMSGTALIFLSMYLGLNMKVNVGGETAQGQAAFSALLIVLHVAMTGAAIINMVIVTRITLDSGRQRSFVGAMVA